MGLSLKDRVEIPDTVVSRDLDGEAVILNLESSTYFGLDPVGSRIWTLLKEQGSLCGVFDIMEQEYDVDAVRLEDDLLQLTARLCELGLIRVVTKSISKPPIE
jgi:Coenzyme PQQ synthesis protein D (PqqD)